MQRFVLRAALSLLIAMAGLALASWIFLPPLVQVLAPPASELLGIAEDALPGQQRGSRGFVVLASSQPSGALLEVDSSSRGRTPAVANVRCRDGEPVELRIVKAGYRPWLRTVTCRQGGQLDIRARLQPAG